MTKCPCSDKQLLAVLEKCPNTPAGVLAKRVLDARKRGIPENRHAGEGVSWGRRQQQEGAEEYLRRTAEKALKRAARSRNRGRHTGTKTKRDTRRAYYRGTSAEKHVGYIMLVQTEWNKDMRDEFERHPPREGETVPQYHARIWKGKTPKAT